MMSFFLKSKRCAKKRLIECIKTDRRSACFDGEKIRREIECVLSRYVELDGEIKLEIINENNNRRYITAGAFIK